MPSFHARLLAALVVFGLVAACGGAAEQAPARSPGGGRKADDAEKAPPMSVEEAQEQIRLAREQLFGPPPADARNTTEPTTSSTTPREPAAEPAARPSAPRAEVQPDHQDKCASPCRALASMRRAVTALCRMTGDTDERCETAQRTLKESETRAATCRCASP
jgi:hypothetical protein